MSTDGTITIPTQTPANVDAPGSSGFVREFVDSGDSVVKWKLSSGQVVFPYTGKIASGSHGVPWFDIAEYGTVDRAGVASSDTAVTAAMTALAASPRGGILYLGPGLLNISTGIIDFSTGVGSTTAPVCVLGSDRGLTLIFPNGTGDIVKFNSGVDGCSIRNLGFWASTATQTAGNAINTNGADDVAIDNILFNNQFVDVNINNSSIKVSVTHTVHTHGVSNGATSVGVLVTNGAAGDTYIGPDVVMSDTGATRRRACIEVTQSGHFEVNQCNLTGSAQGLLVDPGAGLIVADGFINQSLFDSNTVNGVTLNAASSTSTIKSFEFVNSWFSGTVTGAGLAGFLSTGTAGGIINGIGFTACRALNNQTHGWQHGFGTDFEWNKCRGSGNSSASSGVSSGISIAAAVSNWAVNGGKYGGTDGAPTGGQQKYGIEVVAGAGNNIRIIAADLIGNLTQGLLMSATGVDIFVDGCLNGPRCQARRIAADATAITATTATDVPGMSFDVEVGANYAFAFEILATDTSVTGIKFAVVVPTGATLDAVVTGWLSATTLRQDVLTASGTLQATAINTTITTTFHHRIAGVVQGASSAGVCKLQAAVVTSGSLVVKRGSAFLATPALT